jgi:hypothetical protein
MKISVFFFLIIFSLQIFGQLPETGELHKVGNKIKGIVFHDRNDNGFFDQDKDIPLKGIAVSNGRDIVLSDTDGRYQLDIEEDPCIIFLIKPKNWRLAINEYQIPYFYYIYSPNGVKSGIYDGLEPTNDLPESIDFPLYPNNEPDKFNVLVFGDTQPRTISAVHYFYRDIIEELVGIDSIAFGVTLGDVVSDFLYLYEPMKQSIATLGIPWRYVVGNHDLEHTLRSDKKARGPWYRSFGPTYYSFSYGAAHFIVLDNIRLTEDGNPTYKTGLGDRQMEFLKNELSRLNKDQLLFIMAHIPWESPDDQWFDDSEKYNLYRMLSEFENSVSLVAHTHEYYHYFIDKEQGFPGQNPHHMISVAAVCGSWWMGVPDEYGIPHALGMDGTPKGYTMLHIYGNDWKMSWKAARRPSDFQMSIYVPDEIRPVKPDELKKVTVNIYNALPSAEVEMKINDNGKWIKMDRIKKPDPFRINVYTREKNYWVFPDSIKYWRRLFNSSRCNSEHIWEAEITDQLDPGIYVIYVRAEDEWWKYKGKRLVHIK